MAQKTGFGEARSKNKASAQKKTKAKRRDVESPPWEDDEPRKVKKKREQDFDDVVDARKEEILEEIDTMFGDDNLTDKKVQSIFREQFKALRDDLSADNLSLNSSATARAMTRATLAMLIDLIPVAEGAYRTSKKEQAAYALNALVNQARELSTDLKMMQDVDGQAQFIREMIVDPIYDSLVQSIMTSMLNIKNTVDTQIGAKAPNRARDINTSVDSHLRGLGEFISMSKAKMSTDIYRYLSGDPTLLEGAAPAGGGKKKKKRG